MTIFITSKGVSGKFWRQLKKIVLENSCREQQEGVGAVFAKLFGGNVSSFTATPFKEDYAYGLDVSVQLKDAPDKNFIYGMAKVTSIKDQFLYVPNLVKLQLRNTPINVPMVPTKTQLQFSRNCETSIFEHPFGEHLVKWKELTFWDEGKIQVTCHGFRIDEWIQTGEFSDRFIAEVNSDLTYNIWNEKYKVTDFANRLDDQ